MKTKNIHDSYKKTQVDAVNIPLEYYRRSNEVKDKSYQKLVEVLSVGNMEFFTITVLIGKFIVNDDDNYDSLSGNVNSFFKINDKSKIKDEMYILKALAVQEVDNIYILKDYVAMRDIWQYYSCRGFEKLYEWYSDKNINLSVKIAEELNNVFINNVKGNDLQE